MTDTRTTIRFESDKPTTETETLPEESPPVKGKVKKKKLTKAEKKALALKRQIEFKKLELRQTFKRELDLSKHAVALGREDWEELCKEIKIAELRIELEEWETKAHRLMDQKDEMISMLIEDIETTHEMHTRGVSKHNQLLNFLAESYHFLLESVKAHHECEKQDLLRDYYEDAARAESAKEYQKLYYERIEHAVNIIVEEEMRLSYQIYKEERDERVNNEITKRYMHRDTVVEKMKQLHRAVYNFCMSLKTNTLDIHKYEKIDYLMDRQHNFHKETTTLNAREKKCTQQYVDLQRLLMQLEIESQRKLNDLRLEHAYFLNERKAIKNKMKVDTDITFEKLRILGATSYDVIRKYKDLKKKGDLLLSLGAMCRQYETQSEKIVPWQEAERPIGYREQEEEIFRLQTLDLKMHVDLSEADLLEQFKILKNFWRRQSLVELQNLLLTDEKNRLLEENKKYCDFIRAMNKTDDENELLKALTVTNVLPAPGLPCRHFYWKGKRRK